MLTFFVKKMSFILGKKLNMTRVFTEDGVSVPVTIIEADPCVVTYVKTAEKDGYNSVQLGFGAKKHINKPEKGHLKDLGSFATLKEFRVNDLGEVKVGDKIDVSVFNPGDEIEVTGTSKGKGFQGVVKRHGFKGGPGSHGQKHTKRAPGSIGAKGPERVFKGVKMAGRTGGERSFVRGLKVVSVDKDSNMIFIKGAVPGRKGTLIEIVSQK